MSLPFIHVGAPGVSPATSMAGVLDGSSLYLRTTVILSLSSVGRL